MTVRDVLSLSRDINVVIQSKRCRLYDSLEVGNGEKLLRKSDYLDAEVSRLLIFETCHNNKLVIELEDPWLGCVSCPHCYKKYEVPMYIIETTDEFTCSMCEGHWENSRKKVN